MASAQCSESATGPWNVRVELVAVDLPQRAALDLMPGLRDRQNSTAIRSLWGGVERGDFKLIDRTMVWTAVTAPMVWAHVPFEAMSMSMPLDFVPGSAETTEEMRYPSNFEPPQVPQNFGPGPASGTAPFPENVLHSVPTSFETRNLGLALDVNCRLTLSGLITLDFRASHVSLEGFHKPVSAAVGARNGVWDQPDFRKYTITTSIDVVSGDWKLINSMVISDEKSRIMFFLIRATAIPVRK
jgi:hypothetical protein